MRLNALQRRVVRDTSLGGGFERAGEQPEVERAVRDQADSEAAQRGDQLQLYGSYGEVYRLCSEVRPMNCRAEAADWARATSQPAKLLLPT